MDNDQVAKQLREMISAIGSIQNYAQIYSDGTVATNRLSTVMVSINDDANKLRAQIRELAQTIGVEY